MKVVRAFVEAMVLVFLVMLLFLHKEYAARLFRRLSRWHSTGTFTIMLLQRLFHQHPDHKVRHGAGNRWLPLMMPSSWLKTSKD